MRKGKDQIEDEKRREIMGRIDTGEILANSERAGESTVAVVIPAALQIVAPRWVHRWLRLTPKEREIVWMKLEDPVSGEHLVVAIKKK
jgi:hypothetical protein